MSRSNEDYDTSPPTKRDLWMFRQTGKVLHALDAVSILPTNSLVTSTTKADLICSYNWVDDSTPSVLVPGGAPVWTRQDLPIHIRPDSGAHFVDQNSSRMPRYPFEVVFRALNSVATKYSFDNIDTLVNRNSLRKLFDFCAGRSQDSFRTDLHTIHKTLIIERCERSAREIVHGSATSGYGHNFERAFTKQAVGLENSTSHHRVLRYDLGGLNVAVRFEVDASYRDCEDDVSQEDGDEVLDQTGEEQLATRLGSLKLSPNCREDPRLGNQSVLATPGGHGSAQSTIAELKTSKKSTMSFMPQLWFGRTPYLIRGVHDRGVFQKLVVSRVSDSFQSWETDVKHQMALRKMAGLISHIRDLLVEADEHTAIMIFQKDRPGKLRLFRRTSVRPPLPDEIVQKFWSGNTV